MEPRPPARFLPPPMLLMNEGEDLPTCCSLAGHVFRFPMEKIEDLMALPLAPAPLAAAFFVELIFFSAILLTLERSVVSVVEVAVSFSFSSSWGPWQPNDSPFFFRWWLGIWRAIAPPEPKPDSMLRSDARRGTAGGSSARPRADTRSSLLRAFSKHRGSNLGDSFVHNGGNVPCCFMCSRNFSPGRCSTPEGLQRWLVPTGKAEKIEEGEGATMEEEGCA
mmetsp:Transcript_52896/g.158341  ORF Transcript_52896/g.158341 Transcript_52896/m.158341 type:complete len:221 (+) Transcript_52896:1239-1901(+)